MDENNLSKGINIAVKGISLLLLLLGLILATALFYQVFVLHIECECHDKVFLLSILIAAGLLGSVFRDVLKQITLEQIKRFLSSQETESLIEELIAQAKQQEISEEAESEAIETNNASNYDTVIVPAGRTIKDIKHNRRYLQQLNRPFKKDIKYIAFYVQKKIVGYGEIAPSQTSETNTERIVVLKSFEPLNIIHETSGFYVLNRRYCKLDTLKKARTTSEIN